jgi:hypothetical protein
MNEISVLVKMLNSGEKRFFSLQSDSYERENTPEYIELFRALSVSKETDEAVFLRKNKGKSFTRFFSASKYKLWQRLLTMLVHYHDDDMLLLRLRKQISQADLLLVRGLFDEAEKLLSKTIDTCRKACLFELELEASAVMVKVLSAKGDLRCAEFTERKIEIREIIAEIDTYDLLTMQMFRIVQSNKNLSILPEDLFEPVFKNRCLHENYVQKSVMGKVGWHSLYEQYYNLKGDVNNRMKHTQEIVLLLTENELIAEAYLSPLLIVSANELHNKFAVNDSAGLKEITNRINQSLAGRKKLKNNESLLIDSLLLLGEIYRLMIDQHFEAVLKMEKKIIAISDALFQLKHPRYYLLKYMLIVACISVNNFKKAIRVLAFTQMLPDEHQYDIRFKQYNFLLLFCYLKLGNYDSLKKTITKYRQIFEAQKITRAEELLIDFFVKAGQDKSVQLRQKMKLLNSSLTELTNSTDKEFLKFNGASLSILRSTLFATSFVEEMDGLIINSPHS